MPDSSAPQLLHSSTPTPAPTEAQLNALAEALHNNRPLPDLDLSETQLALLVDSDEITKRLRALDKLAATRRDAATRAERESAELEALAVLRRAMQSKNVAESLRAALAIYRTSTSLAKGRGHAGGSDPPTPPRRRSEPDQSGPAPSAPAPPVPKPFLTADSLLNHQLRLLHTQRPQTPEQVIELLESNLATGPTRRNFGTSPALALYLQHLDATPTIESFQLSPAVRIKGVSSPEANTINVLLARPNTNPLRFQFHFSTLPNAVPPIWVLEGMTHTASDTQTRLPEDPRPFPPGKANGIRTQRDPPNSCIQTPHRAGTCG